MSFIQKLKEISNNVETPLEFSILFHFLSLTPPTLATTFTHLIISIFF